jgi:DNA repair exonuclease SbcCD ATPase subunit
MILNRIYVEHWRCIRQLELSQLGEGINVLFGPNRTGKSSLLHAIRSCLFDADHNSGGKEILTSYPWNGEGPPKVIVEFTAGGTGYRLTKVFSKKKDGTAVLEKRTGELWKAEESAPKEASRRARELLQADKSTTGLNQLLWLAQGEIGLPEQNLDMSLQEKLSGILGVMVTGRDLAFRQELERRCASWFTPTGKESKNSRIAQLEDQRQKLLEVRAKEQTSLHQYEESIRQLEAKQDELPGLELAVRQAKAEVDQLKDDRDRCQERLRLYQQAKNAFAEAEKTAQQAAERVRQYGEVVERWETVRDQLEGALSSFQKIDSRWKDCESVHAEKVKLLDQARGAEEEHQLSREELDDRRKLLDLTNKIGQIETSLSTLQKEEEGITELEQEVQSLIAPDKQTLADLQSNRREATQLRAQLAAQEWQLTVSVPKPIDFKLSMEGEASQPITLSPGQTRSWSLRQYGQIDLGDFGTITVRRRQENRDLTKTLRELELKDREYQDQVLSFREDPNDESCLDRLTERRIRREAALAKLTNLRTDALSMAPTGKLALLAERDHLLEQRRIILKRRPDWSDWQPCETHVNEAEKQFDARAKGLRVERTNRERDVKESLTKLNQANRELQEARETLAAAKGSERALHEELQRFGDENALRHELDRALAAKEQAAIILASHQPTEAELAIEDRFHEAESALEKRNKRLGEVRSELDYLRGILRDKEGLHTKLADAEAACDNVEQLLARERVEAGAYKRLRDLFDECRDNQVRQVMGPIASRVVEWSKKIGLDDCQEVRFGDAFLPQGMLMKSSTLAEPVPLEVESYGTWEQLSIIVRLALGGVLAKDEPQAAILDDPLAHTDAGKHRKILEILRLASEGNPSWSPPAGRLQIIILTCHPDRFDHLPLAKQIDLSKHISH